MKNKLLFFCIVAAILWGGCSTKCPFFPEELKAYLPLSKEENVAFCNKNGDTLHVVLNEIYEFGGESIEWCSKCECNIDYAQVYKGDINIRISVSYFEKENSIQIIGNFNDENYVHGSSVYYYNHVNDSDSLLLLTDERNYVPFVDSVLLVKDIGVTCFVARDGGRYTLVQ